MRGVVPVRSALSIGRADLMDGRPAFDKGRGKTLDRSGSTRGAPRALYSSRRRGRRDDGRILVLELHDRPWANHGGEVESVPIGQPDAAVRLRLADRFGRRRSMDAIGRRGQVDPNETDR